MVELEIRDVSDEDRAVLARAAEENAESLQAYLLRIVKAEAAKLRNREIIESLRGRTDGSRSTLEDSMKLKYELRAERERQLLGDD